MECGFFGILAAFIMAGVVFLVLVLNRDSKSGKHSGPAEASSDPQTTDTRGAWEEVAERLGGALKVELGDHILRFQWHGVEAMLHEEWNELRFRIDGREFGGLRLVINYRSEEEMPRDQLEGMIGGRSHRTARVGEFHVHSSELPRAQEFLSTDVQRVFLGLGKICDHADPSVEIGDSLVITVKWVVRDARRLARLSVLCLQMAQLAWFFTHREEGVTFLKVEMRAGGECKVCGALLEGVLVRCARCTTPHHRDCWEYTGSCSTYACGCREMAG